MGQSNIAGIIIGLMGSFLCGFPKVIWKISEKWKSGGASAPSAKYLTIMRIVGAVFPGAGFLLLLGIIK